MRWEGHESEPGRGKRSNVRMGVLVILGVLVSNVAAGAFVDRDAGLGVDDLLVVAAGVGMAFLVESGLRRSGR